jgi:hypothetical protein
VFYIGTLAWNQSYLEFLFSSTFSTLTGTNPWFSVQWLLLNKKLVCLTLSIINMTFVCHFLINVTLNEWQVLCLLKHSGVPIYKTQTNQKINTHLQHTLLCIKKVQLLWENIFHQVNQKYDNCVKWYYQTLVTNFLINVTLNEWQVLCLLK